MIEEFKTTVITFDKNEGGKVKYVPTSQVNVNDEAEENVIKNVLFNVTTKVPHVTTSVPVVEVQETPKAKKAGMFEKIEKINANAKSFPTFYRQEIKRSRMNMIVWIIVAIAIFAFEGWALAKIILNPGVSNWVALTLIPGAVLAIAFLVVYITNYLNFKSEARNVDFSQEKIVTTNVSKLYKRLKTGYINVNWFCSLVYVLSLLCLLINYMVAYFTGTIDGKHVWGVLTPSRFAAGNAFLICFIVDIVAIFVAFLMHVYLLVRNYTRAAKIDNFYNKQIISDEELNALKKKKNKRNAIIFIAVVICIALIGIFIYKIVTSKRNQNTITINNK